MNTVRERVEEILRGRRFDRQLDALCVAPVAEVDAELIAVLRETFTAVWRRGWQPVELHRFVGQRARVIHTHLVTDAVATCLRDHPAETVDPRWLAQADPLAAQVWWTEPAGYLKEFAGRWRLDRVTVLRAVLRLILIVTDLPPIEVLLPPPGAAVGPGRTPDPGRLDTRLLDRIRALLAKAESTTFPAEAQAYTAKAQQLISRHSIDEALLTARSGEPAVVPFARRIGVEQPYANEKAALLNTVTRANRGRVVWSPEFGFATVFGFDSDLDAVDLIYTSLLVQARRSMAQTEPPSGRRGREALRAFRRSFLIAFADRIGERLAGAAEAAFADATGQDGAADRSELLPVLASREEQVQAAMRQAFPRTVPVRRPVVDSVDGWYQGKAAADRAALHPGQPLTGR